MPRKKPTTAAKPAKKTARLPNAQEREEIARDIAQRTGVRPPTQGARQHAAKPGMSLKPRIGWLVCRPDAKGKGGPMRIRENQQRAPLRVNGHLYDFAPNQYGDHVAQVLFPDDYVAILSISAAYQPYDVKMDHTDPDDEPEYVPPPTVRKGAIPKHRAPPPPQASQPQRQAVKPSPKPKGAPLSVDPAVG